MTTKSIPLTHVRLAARQGGLELSLDSSMTLDFPASFQHITSLSDLTRATNKEQLWIARLGCSHVTISFNSLGESLCTSESEAVAAWIKSHQVWPSTKIPTPR